MRIVQLLPTMTFGDAVSNDAAAIGKLIAGMGYETAIYASNIDPRLAGGSVLPMNEMRALKKDDILIYHGSTGDPLNRMVSGMNGRKMMRYHNITPPRFFRGYSPRTEELTESGYRQMREIAGAFPYCVAVSDYNRQDLRKLGYNSPIDICPILIPFEDYSAEPDNEVLERYMDDGWVNLLFVGRIAPNKCQQDVIRAFYDYHYCYNPRSRLFLVGNAAGMERYRTRLENYVEALGLKEQVIFSGQISFRAMLAYYRLADVFVCMSEHEGFCVPLVEAMFFGKPIVAYAAAAVPETLGKGGLLLEEKDPHITAAAVDRILRDRELRDFLAEGQKEKLREYHPGNVGKRMMKCLENMIG